MVKCKSVHLDSIILAAMGGAVVVPPMPSSDMVVPSAPVVESLSGEGVAPSELSASESSWQLTVHTEKNMK